MPVGDDDTLIERAIGGDETALDQLFRRYYARMHRFAQRVCDNAADAEDVAQDAFISLMASIGTFDRRSAFSSWLYQVVLNKAIDFRRKGTRRRRLTEDLRLVSPEASEPLQDDAVTARQVIEIVLDFPEKERDAALLVLGEGLTHSQAAEIIGCPIGTIGWLLTKAGQRLSTILKAESHEPESNPGRVREAGAPAAVTRC